jgi:hypothetical protein
MLLRNIATLHAGTHHTLFFSFPVLSRSCKYVIIATTF